MKRTHRLLGFLLVITMIMGMLMASTAMAADKLTEISVMLFDRGNIPSDQGYVDDNKWTQYANEEMAKLGIKVNYILVPRSEENTKVPVMMASGTAADIMMTYDSASVLKWYQDGGIHDISKELQEYGQQIITYVGEDCLSYGVAADGAQYAIPARRATTASFNAFIRKDWLDKLGLAVPKNVNELYDVLAAFKENDPSGVGKDKLFPLAYSNANHCNTFCSFVDYIDKANYSARFISLPTGAQAGFAYTQPGFKEYFRFYNKAYNAGLMDPEYYTSQFDDRQKQGVVNSTVGYWETAVGSNVDAMRGGLLQNLKANEPDAEFVAIPPFENLIDGKKYVNAYAPTGAFVFIPMTCKNVAAAVQYLNFLAGEGGKTMWFGFEGVHYQVVDGVPMPIDSELNAKELDWIHHDTFLVGNQGYYATNEEFIAAIGKTLPEYEDYLVADYTLAMDGIPMSNTNYVSPTQAEQSGNLNMVNENYLVKLFTCDPAEFDALYDEYISELEKYDIEKILQERADYYGVTL